MNIGDIVWVATWEREQRWLPCPDCFGKKFLTVILGDDSRVTIPCSECGPGYNSSRGVVETWEERPSVAQVKLTGLELRPEGMEYRSHSSYYKADRVFKTEEEAKAGAVVLTQQHNEEQKKRMLSKERGDKTWGWNATYHRNCIRTKTKEIAYHTEKLEAAKLHVKEEKVAVQ